jgi:heat shock protein HslJ
VSLRVAAALIVVLTLPCHIHRAFAQEPAAVAASAPSPREIHWNLIELDGNPLPTSTPDDRPYLYLQSQGDKVSGSLGCNRLFGSYDLSGNSIEFHSIAATRMACANESMETEAKMIDLLKLATSFQVIGDVLSLRVDDRVLARFQAEKQK